MTKHYLVISGYLHDSNSKLKEISVLNEQLLYPFTCTTQLISVKFILHWGAAVAQLVEALRYKPERRGFDSRWCHWNFSLT
jgi:hypothetical protein